MLSFIKNASLGVDDIFKRSGVDEVKRLLWYRYVKWVDRERSVQIQSRKDKSMDSDRENSEDEWTWTKEYGQTMKLSAEVCMPRYTDSQMYR